MTQIAGNRSRWLNDPERLPQNSEDYRELLTPVETEVATPDGAIEPGVEVTPFVVRFLQLERGPRLLARHLLALERVAHAQHWLATTGDGVAAELAETNLASLQEFFALPTIAAARDEVVAYLVTPTSSLHAFVDRLARFWGERFEDFGLVLVLDQFEEMFTRFVDQRHRGAAADPSLPSWTLRPAFFAALGELVAAAQTGEPKLPVRVLISMRDDYIADLDQLQQHARILEEARYHLGALRKEDLRHVIREPARIFRFTYAPEILDDLERELPMEEDRVEPGHVQIICVRLWDRAGRELARRASHRADAAHTAFLHHLGAFLLGLYGRSRRAGADLP